MKYYRYVSPMPTTEQEKSEQTTRMVGIKPNNYSSRLTQINDMLAVLQADFPGLVGEDVHVVAYDGDRWKRQMGLEFSVPIDTPIPEEYVESQLEFVFAGN